jgi:hypothetical protein
MNMVWWFVCSLVFDLIGRVVHAQCQQCCEQWLIAWINTCTALPSPQGRAIERAAVQQGRVLRFDWSKCRIPSVIRLVGMVSLLRVAFTWVRTKKALIITNACFFLFPLLQSKFYHIGTVEEYIHHYCNDAVFKYECMLTSPKQAASVWTIRILLNRDDWQTSHVLIRSAHRNHHGFLQWQTATHASFIPSSTRLQSSSQGTILIGLGLIGRHDHQCDSYHLN